METKKIHELHAENQQSLNVLGFYKDDLKILENRISEIASKNTSKEALAQVEHFQNQFIVQRNNIDELKHKITLDQNAINANILANPIASDHRQMQDHVGIREEAASLDKVIQELRHEINKFCARWM